MLVRLFLIAALAVSLTACSTSPGGRGGSTAGEYKIGKPYEINGVWYYPKEDYRYDETGIASWYGADFHGKRTANGESFDQNELTAAHRTLPMPSLVRVTNLENGRSVVVRVNDRGPFAHGRVIDLSRRGAQLLGFEGNGTAKVRVQLLEIESKAIADAAKRRGMTGYPTQTAAAAPKAPEAVMPPVAEQGVVIPEDAPVEERVAAAYGDVTSGTAPQSARRDAVESVRLDAPVAAVPLENEADKITRAVAAAPIARPVTQKQAAAPKLKVPVMAAVKEPKLTSVAGHQREGRFYPDAKVEQRPVKGGSSIYVQAGAFSVKSNAQKLKEKLSGLAPASISEATVNGSNFYRVRLGPMKNVDEADRILAKVLGTDKKARITVE